MLTKLGIIPYMPNVSRVYMEVVHIYATYEVTAINHATRSTVYIFDIYYLTNIYATLQRYVSLHCYYIVLIDPIYSTCITLIQS